MSLAEEQLVKAALTRTKQQGAGPSALAALQGPPPRWATWLADMDALAHHVGHLARPCPISVLPVGVTDGGEVLGLDLSPAAADREILPVLRSTHSGHWEHVAPSLPALCEAVARPRPLADGPFEAAAEAAPTSFAVHARQALAERQDGNSQAEATRIVSALQRPLHTADSAEQIALAQARADALDPAGLIDPMTSRLARAGADPVAWRTIGAERAVAGKARDALRALDGAHYHGAPFGEIEKVLRRMYVRCGWGFGARLLTLHGRCISG